MSPWRVAAPSDSLGSILASFSLDGEKLSGHEWLGRVQVPGSAFGARRSGGSARVIYRPQPELSANPALTPGAGTSLRPPRCKESASPAHTRTQQVRSPEFGRLQVPCEGLPCTLPQRALPPSAALSTGFSSAAPGPPALFSPPGTSDPGAASRPPSFLASPDHARPHSLAGCLPCSGHLLTPCTCLLRLAGVCGGVAPQCTGEAGGPPPRPPSLADSPHLPSTAHRPCVLTEAPGGSFRPSFSTGPRSVQRRQQWPEKNKQRKGELHLHNPAAGKRKPFNKQKRAKWWTKTSLHSLFTYLFPKPEKHLH